MSSQQASFPHLSWGEGHQRRVWVPPLRAGAWAPGEGRAPIPEAHVSGGLPSGALEADYTGRGRRGIVLGDLQPVCELCGPQT